MGTARPDPLEISVVLVSRDTRELLLAAVSSVVSVEEPAAEVVVVDNASTDGSVEAVRRAFPRVRVLANPHNPGYGAAANRGIAACASPYVLLLNSDTVVRPGALRALAGYLKSHPRAGVAGPRLENPDGTLQRSCFDFLGTLRLAVEKSPLGPRLASVPALRDRWLIHHGPHDRPRPVPWVLGAALALRREAFDAVGGFDPGFFLYAEEVDLCYRLRQAGWEVHFAPVATVVHAGGASTSPRRAEMEVQRTDSARRFYRRHYSPLRVAVLDGLIRTAAGIRRVRR